jgi:Membrane bound FAD containing D-sorbitol dehydrogenase
MLETFLALSRVLTGVEDLDIEFGRQYLDRLSSSPFDPFLRQILDRFRDFTDKTNVAGQVKQEILADPALRPTICQIILLWYTSAMWDNQSDPIALRYGTQEEYFSGLAWQIIGAHAPGVSGGYFGHWRYRPDNEPRADA